MWNVSLSRAVAGLVFIAASLAGCASIDNAPINRPSTMPRLTQVNMVAGDDTHVIDAHPADVVDTTGAGDLFAASFLYGLTHGRPLATCGQLGSFAAAEVISHLGARPAVALADAARPLLGA